MRGEIGKLLNKLKREQIGFTLIELIVVIAVLSVLATLIVPKVIGVKGSAEDMIQRANEQIIKNALERYYAQNGEYPEDQNGKLPDEELEEYLDIESVDLSKWLYERKSENEYDLKPLDGD